MSRRVNTSSQKPVQKFCKVCQDAGKSESEYRSHFTRETPEPNSRVLCPTLLALECRFCYKKGHTVKYCTTFKNKDKDRQPKRESQLQKIESKQEKKMSNTFACLDSDSEEEQPKQVLVEEEFPQLCVPISINSEPINAPKIQNYASALAYIAPAPQPTIFKAIEKPVAQNLASQKEKKKVSQVRPPWALNDKKLAQINWAAWDTDSEEEDEEDKTEFIYMTDAQYKAQMYNGQYDNEDEEIDEADDW
jgi:hypothetical protein